MRDFKNPGREAGEKNDSNKERDPLKDDIDRLLRGEDVPRAEGARAEGEILGAPTAGPERPVRRERTAEEEIRQKTQLLQLNITRVCDGFLTLDSSTIANETIKQGMAKLADLERQLDASPQNATELIREIESCAAVVRGQSESDRIMVLGVPLRTQLYGVAGLAQEILRLTGQRGTQG